MLKVVVAIVVLLGIVLIRQIPKIGGNIHAALLAAGVATMLCAGMLNPGDWLVAWVDGINRIAWIMALSITGGIFAEISQELGTVDTIIGVLNAKFGQKPRALIVSIIFVLVVAGSLLGDAVAAATVIGALTIGVLVSMNIKLELISAISISGGWSGKMCSPWMVRWHTSSSSPTPCSLYHRLSAQPARAFASTSGSTREVMMTTLMWGQRSRMRFPDARPEWR